MTVAVVYGGSCSEFLDFHIAVTTVEVTKAALVTNNVFKAAVLPVIGFLVAVFTVKVVVTATVTILVVIVPDRRSQILEVVIVRRLVTWVLGIWRGEGLRKGEKGEVSLQAT